jgi:diacylglycerol kinase
MIFQQKGAKALSSTVEQSAEDLREAAGRVGDAASAATVLLTVLAAGVLVALTISVAAYARAGQSG